MTLLRPLALLGAALALTLPVSAQTPPKKVLRVTFRVAETSFDPLRVDDLYSRTVTGHIFESPYTYDPLANPPQMVPLTADGMPEVSSDYRVWTIHIKPGIYFTDDPAFGGKKRELVAQDYVYTYERAVDPATRSPEASQVVDQHILGLNERREQALKTGKFDYDAPVEGLKALDRYTVQFRLKDPRPGFAVMNLAATDILGAEAREVVEHYGNEVDAHPVGTGPFVLKQWRRASEIVLERNPAYRVRTYDAHPAADDAEGQAILARLKGRRIPMIDEVRVSIIEEGQPRWLSFLNGQSDTIGAVTSPVPDEFVSEAVPGGKVAPSLAKKGIQAFRSLDAGVDYAVFNMENPLVGGYTADKVALRRAISLAFDTDRYIRLVRRGQAVPAQSHALPHTSSYDPKFKSEMSAFSPARAKALLDLYGYVDRNGDGWREMPDGTPLVLHMASQSDSQSRRIDEEWDHDMRAVGLRMVFDIAQWPENLKRCKTGDFMMWWLGSSAADPDGFDGMQSFYSGQKGEQNLARVSLPALDKLYDQIGAIADGPEREKLFFEAKKLATAYMPYKDLDHRLDTDLVYPWVIGYRRPQVWVDWWEYVDIDPVMQAKALQR
jgi:ABC-type transport system substrate-binding protein